MGKSCSGSEPGHADHLELRNAGTGDDVTTSDASVVVDALIFPSIGSYLMEWWVICRNFGRMIAKSVEYLTLRRGFLSSLTSSRCLESGAQIRRRVNRRRVNRA